MTEYSINPRFYVEAVAGNPSGAAQRADNEPFVYDSVALTPEMILALVRRRLANADDQITAVMDTIDQSTRRGELYARRQQILLALRSRVQAEHGGDPDDSFDVDEFYDNEGSDMVTIGDETKPLHEWLEDVGLTWADAGINDGKATLSSLEDALEAVKQDSRTEASGSEMNMLQLQQLMQQRSQIIQLGTNLSKKIAEGESAIVNNLR